ncbi:MAG: hypothetical protein OXF56_27050 [Rhodobacteraceae bacterium]|nr:hypothetical protein [Paracoccaceae bacterium]
MKHRKFEIAYYLDTWPCPNYRLSQRLPFSRKPVSELSRPWWPTR